MKTTLFGTTPTQSLMERIGPQELRRRLWHFFPGIVALLLTAVPHRDPIRLPIMFVIVSLGVLLPAWIATRCHNLYRRSADEDCVPVILGFAVPISLMALLFRAEIEMALSLAAIIAFGDGSATIAGMLRQGDRLSWNRRKSWAGLNAFLIVGTAMATLVYWRAAEPVVPLATALMCVGPAVFVSALVETLPLRVNDNIAVGVTASVMLVLMQTLLLGWPTI